MPKSFDVLVIGELNVDIILNGIASFPEIGKEILSDHMTLTMGSSSAIFASNLSTLGTGVAFLGKLGNDNFGDFVIKGLQAKNIDTSLIDRSSEFSTGATIVLSYNEDRANITFPGAMKDLTVDDIPEMLFRNVKHLHMSSVFLQSGMTSQLVTLFSKAKSAGLTTSIDPQWDPSEKWHLDLRKLLPYVDVFMPNISELKALTKTNDMNEALASLNGFANTIVVKSGNQGAYLWNNGKIIHQSPFLNKQVVDSIGAGDSFDSGFIHAFLNNKSHHECLQLGALMGAINTTRAGGTGAFESLSMVKSIAQSIFNFHFE